MLNPSGPQLMGLSTAVPTHVLEQSEAECIASDLFSDRSEDFARLRPVFENTGIKHRHLAMPVDWYLELRGWEERTDVYIEAATDLFCKAAQKALAESHLSPSDIDIIVSVSSTGIATPSLEARAHARMGFRNDALRVPIFGLGCAGGVAGLTVASRLAAATPDTNVLFVAVEICSMAFRPDKPTNSNIVATALFADGAAAGIISSHAKGHGVCLGEGRQYTWPETLGIMGWNVDPNGFEVIFDRAIPPFARRHVRPIMDQFLKAWEHDTDTLERLSFHPGGTKVLEALENAFELTSGALDIERDVLCGFGNMSAPTALFVLKRELEQRTSGTSILTALGPGFTAAAIPVSVNA
ncbi:MAG: type III polyketide synthase [Pseudomonadota bacterium]